MTDLIAISGKIGSGKDTVCSMLQTIYKSEKQCVYTNKKFAHKLKLILSIILDCHIDQLQNNTFKNKQLGEKWWYYRTKSGTIIPYDKDNSLSHIYVLIKPTPRTLMQKIGTECIRLNINPNIWVFSLFNTYNPQHSKWIISDMRFMNELDAVNAHEGITIRINRNINHHKDTHASENELDHYTKWDFVIDNDGTLNDLYKKVYSIYHKITNRTPNCTS